jgi:hypothetical protein
MVQLMKPHVEGQARVSSPRRAAAAVARVIRTWWMQFLWRRRAARRRRSRPGYVSIAWRDDLRGETPTDY